MPHYPLPQSSRLQSPDFSGNTIIAVASAAAAGTKGAWTTLISSLNFDCDGFMVGIAWGSTSRISLIDIGIGAAASEVVIVPDLPYEQAGTIGNGCFVYYIPIPVKAGTRIAARANISGATTKQVAMWIQPFSGGFVLRDALDRVTTYGITPATPVLTNIDPGATIGTKGAYTQLIASTTDDIKVLQFVTAKTGNNVAIDWKVDLAIGAGGSEQIIIPDYYCGSAANVGAIPQPSVSLPIPISIAAGTRLAARCSCSISTAGGRTLDVAVVGME